ncbi:MAG: hypothetical protein ACYTEQ_12655 [Planctomycetota bacterium]|jgi:hypothetical protein
MSDKRLFTVGQIADHLGEPPARVAYIVSKYRLKSVGRVGIIRLFDEEQVKVIKEGLYCIRIRRT